MGEAISRILIFLVFLGLGFYFVMRPESPPVAESNEPVLYQKGQYLGPADTPLGNDELEALKHRARNDYAPRL